MGFISVELDGGYNGVDPLSITWSPEVTRMYLLTEILSLRDTKRRFPDLEIRQELAVAVMELEETHHPSSIEKKSNDSFTGGTFGTADL